MPLTKKQAMQSLKHGHTLRHRSFTEGEWIKLVHKHSEVYEFDDECKCLVFEFWDNRTEPSWDDGWSIIIPKHKPEPLELTVMLQYDCTTVAELFNDDMAIHSPCGNGIILLTKAEAMQFFNLKE